MSAFTVFSDQIEILAPQQLVWDILYDIERYPEWNPFTEKVITSFAIGTPVDLYVRLPKRGQRLQREYITVVEPPLRLGWGMNMINNTVLKARRMQTIKNLSSNRCCYHTEDSFTGLLTPVIKLLFADSIRTGFNAMGYALKTRAEQQFQKTQQSKTSLEAAQ
jgi:hypothetical protein